MKKPACSKCGSIFFIRRSTYAPNATKAELLKDYDGLGLVAVFTSESSPDIPKTITCCDCGAEHPNPDYKA